MPPTICMKRRHQHTPGKGKSTNSSSLISMANRQPDLGHTIRHHAISLAESRNTLNHLPIVATLKRSTLQATPPRRDSSPPTILDDLSSPTSYTPTIPLRARVVQVLDPPLATLNGATLEHYRTRKVSIEIAYAITIAVGVIIFCTAVYIFRKVWKKRCQSSFLPMREITNLEAIIISTKEGIDVIGADISMQIQSETDGTVKDDRNATALDIRISTETQPDLPVKSRTSLHQTIPVSYSPTVLETIQVINKSLQCDIVPALGAARHDNASATSSLTIRYNNFTRKSQSKGSGVDDICGHSRPRQGSGATKSSEMTSTTRNSVFSSILSSRSSTTSIAAMDSEFDMEDIMAEETEFEVRRAQTRSMEVKKGVLMAWSQPSASLILTKHDRSNEGSAAPQLTVTHPSITIVFLKLRYSEGNASSFPHASLEDTSKITSSISSVSVDLDDFPNPPSPMVPANGR